MKTSIEIVRNRFLEYEDRNAIYWNGGYYSYKTIFSKVDIWHQRFQQLGIKRGRVCGVLGDYSPEIAALFFALMEARCILVPFTKEIKELNTFKEIAGLDCLITFDANDDFQYEKYSTVEKNSLLKKQIKAERSGLIVFSSGSTGVPKGILQDCERVMNKFLQPRKGWKTISFLMMDHFGGFNTFLSVLANGGLAVCIEARTPDNICKAIEATNANLLPTTPTFLNLLLASQCYKKYNISSLEMITYGTEMMNVTTLNKLKETFPQIQLKQTYGLSELGVLRSKSKNDGSLWLKVGGSEFETKIIDNILWIRAESNMVGYLNADNPFDEDGWFCTGDTVEQNGEYIHFVGRTSEIINVGGQKVFPAEVEAVILEDKNINEVTVFGESHRIMGQIVAVRVSLREPESLSSITMRIRKICSEKLEKYKIPIKVIIMENENQYNNRFKKIRK